jgi:hypothetical protein
MINLRLAIVVSPPIWYREVIRKYPLIRRMDNPEELKC